MLLKIKNESSSSIHPFSIFYHFSKIFKLFCISDFTFFYTFHILGNSTFLEKKNYFYPDYVDLVLYFKIFFTFPFLLNSFVLFLSSPFFTIIFVAACITGGMQVLYIQIHVDICRKTCVNENIISQAQRVPWGKIFIF